jgi:Domain of unknown function (DUF4337)
MPEHPLPADGAHEKVVGHETQPGSHGIAGRLAVATAIIATITAFFGYLGGLTEANAGLYKNEAAIRKTEASNQWNYYQAKSSKQNLAELAIELTPESRRAFYVGEVSRYKIEKEAIKKDAEKFERESDEWSKRSDEEIHQHHRWSQATTALQISIALAAIALLTRSRQLQFGVYGLAGVGLVVGLLAWLHI